MKYVTFLIVLAAASLAACGKDSEAPVTEAPTAEVDAPPVATPEPLLPVPPDAPLEPPPPPSAATPAVESPAVPATKSDLAHGQQIYRQACAFCHDKGVAGAPKTGDRGAWSPRLAQGMDALYASALKGKGAMPAKGGNPSLADADVKAAVDHLAAQVH